MSTEEERLKGLIDRLENPDKYEVTEKLKEEKRKRILQDKRLKNTPEGEKAIIFLAKAGTSIEATDQNDNPVYIIDVNEEFKENLSLANIILFEKYAPEIDDEDLIPTDWNPTEEERQKILEKTAEKHKNFNPDDNLPNLDNIDQILIFEKLYTYELYFISIRRQATQHPLL